MLIRTEEEKDRSSVRALNLSAFDTSAEADLIDVLREQTQPIISLVAENENAVIGHILFSPVSLTGHPGLKIMRLAFTAVVNEHRHHGIGSALVRVGLEQCRRHGCGAVVVLGHPEYYACFGFTPAACFGVGCEYDRHGEGFMIMELQPGYLEGRTGIVKYHAAFKNICGKSEI